MILNTSQPSGKVSEADLLDIFIAECRPYCESFDGLLIPSRRTVALWITLGLADGEMTPVYRHALERLRKELKHSALLYGAMGALPVYSAACIAGGTGMGIFAAIAGGLQGLKHKQTLDQTAPLISDDFMKQAENLIGRIIKLEEKLAAAPDTELQSEYNALIAELEELIAPDSAEEADEADE